MNETPLKENCHEQKGELIQEFAILTIDELIYSAGKKGRDAWKASNQTWQIKRRIAQADNRTLITHVFPSFPGIR